MPNGRRKQDFSGDEAEKSRRLRQTPGVQFPNNLPVGDFTKNIAKLPECVKENRAQKQSGSDVERHSISGPEKLDSMRLMRQNQLLRDKLDYWKSQVKDV